MSAKEFYTLDDLRSWREIAPTLDPPARVAVIGDPIAHSRSPQMHNPALAARGIHAQYIRVWVPPGSVAESLRLFAENDFIGVNCTIPHKIEALSAMNSVDPLAEKIGAVNTVLIRDAKFTGFNSDGPGFLQSVVEVMGKSVRDLRVLIIGGGGGAGRAVAVQCVLEKCREVVLVSRSREKLEAADTQCRKLAIGTSVLSRRLTIETFNELIPEVDIVVNATPVGMKVADEPLFDPALLHRGHLVFDIVYRSSGPTPLIKAAKLAGAKVCDGLTLLLHQGAISFAHWYGGPVPLEEMRRGLMSV